MREHEQIPFPDYQEYDVEEMQRRARDFYAEIKRRHTARSFSDRPVPRSVIEDAIRAAGTAPSGANHQPWFFSVIGSPEVKRQVRILAEAEEKAFYAGKAGEEWLGALAPLGTDENKPYLEIAP
jgi:nitroreductase